MRVAALAGGVGGAKLAVGLYQCLEPDALSVIVNTADDLDLYGLRICPDLDTVMYTLAGTADPHRGWGIAGDTRNALAMMASYGEDPWFTLGDRDLAAHILRTQRLRGGARLTEVTHSLSAALGVRARLLPMSDEQVATVVATNLGELEFQEYFVRRRHAPEVRSVRFRGIESATPTHEVVSALRAADLLIVCPSNPIVSIGPILGLAGMQTALSLISAPAVAVSPIVGGRALKGPADHMLASLGHESSALGVARMYAGIAQGMVIDDVDAPLAAGIEDLGMAVLVTDTVMRAPADRVRLAERILSWVGAGLPSGSR